MSRCLNLKWDLLSKVVSNSPLLLSDVFFHPGQQLGTFDLPGVSGFILTQTILHKQDILHFIIYQLYQHGGQQNTVFTILLAYNYIN